MQIRTTGVGSYPKPPAEGRPFVLRTTLHAVERGEATPDDVRNAQDELTKEVIAEQEAAGIDIPTDGQVRWDDILTPFAKHTAGFEIGGLLRWFDNNVYYRRPVCVDEVEWRGSSSVKDWSFAQSVTERPVKAVLPGPITFARLSLDEHYHSHERFVMAISRVLAQEAFELEAAGVRYLQIDEPALVEAPEDLELAQRALGAVVAELNTADVTLATYFGEAKRLGSALFGLPVHRVGLDLISAPHDIELVRDAPSEIGVQAGIVDARNTMLEDVDDLVRTIEELAGTLGADRLWVSPSAGLEYLPREKARAKLERLSEATRKAVG